MSTSSGEGTGTHFHEFDFSEFWDDNPYSLSTYVEPAPSHDLVASVQDELGGYRLPGAYVELARIHNGGIVRRCCYPTHEPTGWAEDHIEITGLYAIGRTAHHSLCGDTGSRFMQDEWGYPTWGVAIADTPTAGHEQIMLDYRECGRQGEPQVVYVDQESDYRVTLLAPDFITFIRGLVPRDAFAES